MNVRISSKHDQLLAQENAALKSENAYLGTSKIDVFEVGVWGAAPQIALLFFAEKQKERFLGVP